MRLDGANAPADVTGVEARIAQLSGDAPPRPAASPADRSVAAFQALLASGAGRPDDALFATSAIPSAQLDGLIARAATRNGEDPALVRAIVANESSFDPHATSPVGAQGLMQLMPATAGDLGVTDAYDPSQNIDGGTRYLAGLLRRFDGDVPRAIASYNAGPEAVARGEMPAETAQYVRNVMGSYAQYQAAETKPS